MKDNRKRYIVICCVEYPEDEIPDEISYIKEALEDYGYEVITCEEVKDEAS